MLGQRPDRLWNVSRGGTRNGLALECKYGVSTINLPLKKIFFPVYMYALVGKKISVIGYYDLKRTSFVLFV